MQRKRAHGIECLRILMQKHVKILNTPINCCEKKYIHSAYESDGKIIIRNVIIQNEAE